MDTCDKEKIGKERNLTQKNLTQWKKQNRMIYVGAVAFMLLELLILKFLGMPKDQFTIPFSVCELLNVLYGGYFAFLIKTELPSYYDENKISFYSDHGLRLNMVGLYFNNRNWRPIIRTMCVSLSISIILLPLIQGSFFLLQSTHGYPHSDPMILCFFVFFVLLFVPLYIVGNKYE